MKKIILGLFGIILLVGCASKTYEEIDYQKLDAMLNKKQDFVLFIGSTNCSACSAYKYAVEKIAENYNYSIKYIDISKLTDKEADKLLAKYNYNATPTTIFIKDGKEIDRVVGNIKYSKLETLLKENKYIKE